MQAILQSRSVDKQVLVRVNFEKKAKVEEYFLHTQRPLLAQSERFIFPDFVCFARDNRNYQVATSRLFWKGQQSAAPKQFSGAANTVLIRYGEVYGGRLTIPTGFNLKANLLTFI